MPRLHASAATLLCMACLPCLGQPVSGVWHGKVDLPNGPLRNSSSVELKLVRQGDSLYGTAYYHRGRAQYARFPVKGYFDPMDGTVSWWHPEGEGSDEKGRRVDPPVGDRASFVADFNCPDGERMTLDGEVVADGGTNAGKNRPVHFEKTGQSLFKDEWDEALADPGIDVTAWSNRPKPADVPTIVRKTVPAPPTAVQPPTKTPQAPIRRELPRAPSAPSTPSSVESARPTPESMFAARRRVVVAEIPLKGDLLELNFYDHAEIDGDSVAIFHNGNLLQKNILLKAQPFTIRFPVSELPETNEFTMVAENLGSIPPNTSLVVVYVDGVRHEARLESTESESAVMRFRKPKQP